MKKIYLLSSVLCLFAFDATAADIKPYVGLDFASTYFDIKKKYDYLEKSYGSLSLNAGTRIYDHFGLEAFYQDSGEEKSDRVWPAPGESGKYKSSFEAYGLDVMGYVPAYENAEVFGAIGWGEYKLKIKGFGTSTHEKKNGVRFGAGLQYNFNEHITLRTAARYIYLDSDIAKNIAELSLGVRYSF